MSLSAHRALVALVTRPHSPKIPEELRHAIQSPYTAVREGAVVHLAQLLQGPDSGQAELARSALTQLTHDDSRRVSAAATAALGSAAAAGGAPRGSAGADRSTGLTIERDQKIKGWKYHWPDNTLERYPTTTRYMVTDDYGQFEVLVGHTTRTAWGRPRRRIVVFGKTDTQTAASYYPWAEFVETDDGDYGAKIPDPTDPRKSLHHGDQLPPRLAGANVQRNDVLFRSIQQGSALRLVLPTNDEEAMVSYGYWTATLRGRI